MKRLLIAAAVILGLLFVGGALVVRSMLDPDNVRRTLEAQASAALGQPVTIGSADLALWPRAGVTLTDLVVGQPAVITLRRTRLSTAMRALLGRRIEDAEVSVEDSDVDLPLVLAAMERLATPATSGAQASTPPSDGAAPELTLVNVRAIALRDVRVRVGSRSASFNLDSALSGDRLEVASASVSSEVTSLEATGTIDSLARRSGALTVTADSLDLDGLVAFAQEISRQGDTASSTPQATPGSQGPGPVDITLTIKAARGRAAGVPFETLTATAHVTDQGVRFDPLSLTTFGGQLTGTMAADLAGAEPSVAVTAKAAGLDMARLTEFAGQPGTLTGTFTGAFSVTGRGTDPQRALSAATGQGTASITDGMLPRLDLVRQIVLAFGKPDAAQPAGSGERFSRMGGSFRLDGGVLNINELALESRDLQLDGAGTVGLQSSTLDVKANARLSKELTTQAGRDLVRYTADNGQVVVPVTVTGTLESPRVGVNLASATKRAVTNELQRQTESAIDSLLRRKKKP